LCCCASALLSSPGISCVLYCIYKNACVCHIRVHVSSPGILCVLYCIYKNTCACHIRVHVKAFLHIQTHENGIITSMPCRNTYINAEQGCSRGVSQPCVLDAHTHRQSRTFFLLSPSAPSSPLSAPSSPSPPSALSSSSSPFTRPRPCTTRKVSLCTESTRQLRHEMIPFQFACCVRFACRSRTVYVIGLRGRGQQVTKRVSRKKFTKHVSRKKFTKHVSRKKFTKDVSRKDVSRKKSCLSTVFSQEGVQQVRTHTSILPLYQDKSSTNTQIHTHTEFM